MDRKPLESLKAVSKYNPAKDYEWSPKDRFSVSGEEIDAWNKALTVLVADREYQKFLVIQRAAVLMQDFIKESVEQELMHEVKKEEANGQLESAIQ
jgi:hypothetical protein